MDSTKQAYAKETQVPEWDHVTAAGLEDGKTQHTETRRSKRAVASAKLDSVMPPHRKYVHLSRKAFLIALGVALVVLIALIAGLAGGLSGGSSYVSTHLQTLKPKRVPSLTACSSQ
jgi:hypothetical protein